MKRIKAVEKKIDEILEEKEMSMRRKGYLHIYGVAKICAMLALKRKENVELAMIAGLLHDVYAYKTLDRKEHAHKGSVMAEEILESLGIFKEEEIEIVANAIYNHSDKALVSDALSEILKDADVLEHYLYEPFEDIPAKELPRVISLKKELGL